MAINDFNDVTFAFDDKYMKKQKIAISVEKIFCFLKKLKKHQKKINIKEINLELLGLWKIF